MPKKQSKNLSKEKLIHISIFAVSALLLFSPLLFVFNLDSLKHLGVLGIGIINFIGSATLFFPAPGFLAVGIGGNFYNPLLVAFVAAIGASLGELVGFAFGYSSKKISKSEKHILDFVSKLFHHKYTPLAIVALAFIPNPFFDAVGIVAGAALYDIKKFVILIFIGRLMRFILLAYAGQYYL